VYQQQEQEQEQQQQQEQQDAENPFLDPPFSRIKTFLTSWVLDCMTTTSLHCGFYFMSLRD
jgi:hypothetical protein